MPDRATAHVVLAANARMPSERAQSIQVAHAARGFARAGARTTLVHARRRGTPADDGPRIWDRVSAGGGVEAGPLPELVAAPCVDAIDLVPRRLQFVPARVQEWTFGRSAARIVERDHPGALVVARDVEVAARLAGRPGLAWEVHRVPGGRHRRRLAERFRDAGGRAIAISGGVRDDLVELGFAPDQVLVEHDAFDPALVAAVLPRMVARGALGLETGRPVVLYCGSLLEWKGVDVLVEAARLAPLAGATVVVVGGMARDVEALRARAAGLRSVRIEGFQPSAQVAAYLGAADVTVAPNRRTPRISSHHTSPLKVFEALAAGVPLVASDLPSLREAAGDAAVFVRPEDPEALAEGIARVLGDTELAGRLRAAGRERVRGATWDARAARILDWLTGATAAAGGRAAG